MFFKFEADFVESLRCIPMQVRLKLDTCGIKLRLQEWNLFNQEERRILVESSCETQEEILDYRRRLQGLIFQYTGEMGKELPIESDPAWLNVKMIDKDVEKRSQELGICLSLEQWERLEPLQRFALIKLCHSRHENSNFLPALKEFQLIGECEITPG